MKTNYSPSVSYYASRVLETRRYGHTYVHAACRGYLNYGTIPGDISFSVSGWGRSLQSGGHKFKVHARRNGKPVPSTELRAIQRGPVTVEKKPATELSQ